MALLGRFLMPEIKAHNLHDILFQQDGATCHTARETMNLLRSRFGEQFMFRLGPVDWPPRSCDITPLDFYLWGYVKSKCFVDKLATDRSPRASHSKIVNSKFTKIVNVYRWMN